MSFLTKLDYSFTLFKRDDPEKSKYSDDHLQPGDLTFAATAASGKESLAELLMMYREDIDTVFEWKERLELGNNVISFKPTKYASYHLDVISQTQEGGIMLAEQGQVVNSFRDDGDLESAAYLAINKFTIIPKAQWKLQTQTSTSPEL